MRDQREVREACVSRHRSLGAALGRSEIRAELGVEGLGSGEIGATRTDSRTDFHEAPEARTPTGLRKAFVGSPTTLGRQIGR